jgi:hypothetical protein
MASKYEPIVDYLTKHRGQKLRMTFGEIERVLGFPLPAKSKHVRAWWSNNPNNNVMTAAWLAAGFKTEQVDVAGEVLTFAPNVENNGFSDMPQLQFHQAKAAGPVKSGATGPEPEGTTPAAEKKPYRHPAWGALAGMITLLPDVDLTEPSDPDWGKLDDE